MTPDPKPRQRVRLSPHQLLKLRIEILTRWPWCACGCGRRAETIHHVIGGRDKEDVAENLVGLAGDGTRGCHGALTSGNIAYDGINAYCDPELVAVGIRQTIETTRRDVGAYVVQVKSEAWLDKRYPLFAGKSDGRHP